MIAAIAATNLLVGIVAILIFKPRKKPLCDSCDRLKIKHRGYYNRYCCPLKYDAFTKAPLYCSDYKPRKPERSEGE